MKVAALLFVCFVHFSQGRLIDPPKPENAALMARYVIHNTGWVSLATISTQKNIIGYPFVSLKSFSDGPANKGTGMPYLYMTDMDVSGKDVLVNNKVTIMASLAEERYCAEQKFDPQDPRCAKVMISGTFKKVEDKDEIKFAKEALFSKHPSMKDWPKDHSFYVGKIEISQIDVLDFFGGIKHVSNEEYFNPTLSWTNDFAEVSILDITA